MLIKIRSLPQRPRTFGPVEDTMQILYYYNKGTHFNTIEGFYTLKEALSDNQLNDKHTIFPSMIFDTIIKIGL